MGNIHFYTKYKHLLTVSILASLCLMQTPKSAQAQWPPFSFKLTPTYQAGFITYQIRLVKNEDVAWTMRNVRINIPLPPGTQFIETSGPSSVEMSFDGNEVQFLAPMLPKQRLTGIAFVAKVVEPQRKIFMTRPWISWEGDQAGDFLAENHRVDITRQPLNWVKPPASRLEINAAVTVHNNTVTYFIYPRTVKGRIWDVVISLPLPPGTTAQAVATPAPFTATANDTAVTFSALELELKQTIEPLKIQLSTDSYWRAALQTNILATWKNSGRRVGLTIPIEETIISPNIIFPVRTENRVVVDRQDDAAFANYDLTSVWLQDVYLPDEAIAALKVTFQVAQVLGTQDEPLQFTLFVDQDCNANTGKLQRKVGAEARILYKHNQNRADFATWDTSVNRWRTVASLAVSAPSMAKAVTVWVPYRLLSFKRQFCWLGKARYSTTKFDKSPPSDYIPNSPNLPYLNLMHYEGPSKITTVDVNIPPLPTNDSGNE